MTYNSDLTDHFVPYLIPIQPSSSCEMDENVLPTLLFIARRNWETFVCIFARNLN